MKASSRRSALDDTQEPWAKLRAAGASSSCRQTMTTAAWTTAALNMQHTRVVHQQENSSPAPDTRHVLRTCDQEGEKTEPGKSIRSPLRGPSPTHCTLWSAVKRRLWRVKQRPIKGRQMGTACRLQSGVRLQGATRSEIDMDRKERMQEEKSCSSRQSGWRHAGDRVHSASVQQQQFACMYLRSLQCESPSFARSAGPAAAAAADTWTSLGVCEGEAVIALQAPATVALLLTSSSDGSAPLPKSS